MHCGGVHLSSYCLPILPSSLTQPPTSRYIEYHLALLQLFIHTSIHGSFSTIPAAVIKKSLVISFLNPPAALSPLSCRPRNELATYARLFTYVVFFMILLAAKTSNFVTMFIG